MTSSDSNSAEAVRSAILATAWLRVLLLTKCVVDCSSRRMCAIICSLTFGRVLFINVYMPYECDEASRIAFENELSVIVYIVCLRIMMFLM